MPAADDITQAVGVTPCHGVPDLVIPDLGEDVRLLADAVLAAGGVALAFFGKDPKTWSKPGDSPVTEADIAADRLLYEVLIGARPEYGWLSEETADTPERLGRTRLFVVDPIDGTRAFIGGDPRWAVSAAVVEGDRPVAAALYQPATGDLMLAALGRGAWRGSVRMRVGLRDALEGAALSAPRKFSALEAEARERAILLQPPVPSLALRIAHVADGRADAAFAFGRAHDWDLAAADLLVQEAGGALTDIDGKSLVYNRPTPRHPPLIAAGPGVYTAFKSLYETVLASSAAQRTKPA